MKYRIEDGEVRMPISELNKVNDQVAELEAREAKIQDIEETLLENSVATEICVNAHTEYFGMGMHSYKKYNETITKKYADLDGILKKAVDAETKRMQFYLDEKKEELEKCNKKRRDLYDQLGKARKMSVFEFLKWKR